MCFYLHNKGGQAVKIADDWQKIEKFVNFAIADKNCKIRSAVSRKLIAKNP